MIDDVAYKQLKCIPPYYGDCTFGKYLPYVTYTRNMFPYKFQISLSIIKKITIFTFIVVCFLPLSSFEGNFLYEYFFLS